jgi:hypothetical protein
MWLPIRPDAGRYTFRPVVKEDLSLLDVWLRTPEVIRWWGKPEEQAALLREDPALVLIKPRLLLFGSQCLHRFDRCRATGG